MGRVDIHTKITRVLLQQCLMSRNQIVNILIHILRRYRIQNLVILKGIIMTHACYMVRCLCQAACIGRDSTLGIASHFTAHRGQILT
jgi:hypothetical protein